MIPEGTQKYNEAIDIVIQSASKYEPMEQKDGSVIMEQIIDSEKLWWGFNKIDSDKFGALSFEVKEFERMGDEAFNCMCTERAQQYKDQILAIGESVRSSIDALSSQSRRDKHNSRQTKLDTLVRNKSEHVYSIEDKAKKGGMASLFGGQKVSDDMETN